MNHLEKKIKAVNLTKTEKIIADYLLDNLQTVGFASVKEVANGCGTSDTSVIRFLRTLGYDGFADFKKELNEKFLEQFNANLSPVQKLNRSKDKIHAESLVNDVFYKDIENMTNGMQQLNDALMDKIADCLIQSKRKYIVGFRGTSCCADYMWRKGIFFLEDLILCDKAESETMEKLISIDDSDCLVMFSFPRYSEINFTILELAKKRGAKIIVVTDRFTSPLSPYGDIVVALPVEGIGYTNSYVVPLCFIEALIILIGKKLEDLSEERLEDLEKFIVDSKLY